MAAPQGGNQGDNSLGILWGVAAVFAGMGIIWYAYKTYIIIFYLSIKLYEVDFLNMVSGNHFSELRAAILYGLSHAKALTVADVMMLGQGVGSVLRYPFAFILLVLAFVVYLGNSTRIFRRTYAMNDLVKYEKENWPQISSVADLNLLKTDIDTGPWAMAIQPMQFCKRNKLLEEILPQRREGMARKEWDKIEVILKRGEANRLFTLQLGQLWRGTKNLPPHTRGLFAVFAARINADTKEAVKLLAQFGASSTSKTIDMRGVDELLKKHENTPLVQKVVQAHAYVHTVMASMLMGAREDGVQASADFLWLKPVDRRLWYTLNAVGRQTAFVEIAGIFAHWVAEKEAGRKLLVPMVDEATKALEATLKEIVYRPDAK
jgi:intracellular multiplication protein IcmP